MEKKKSYSEMRKYRRHRTNGSALVAFFTPTHEFLSLGQRADRAVHDAHLLVALVHHFRLRTILRRVDAVNDGVHLRFQAKGVDDLAGRVIAVADDRRSEPSRTELAENRE